MKKITTILLMTLAIAASAQKVTRKDLNRLLLKGDTSIIRTHGFHFVDIENGEAMYERYNFGETIILSDNSIMYTAADVFHNYKRNVEMTPKGDMLWNTDTDRYNTYYTEDDDGNQTDIWEQYDMKLTILEYRTYNEEGVKMLEFFLYRK